jgi:hypothetical protein
LPACRCENRPNSTNLVLVGSRVRPNFLRFVCSCGNSEHARLTGRRPLPCAWSCRPSRSCDCPSWCESNAPPGIQNSNTAAQGSQVERWPRWAVTGAGTWAERCCSVTTSATRGLGYGCTGRDTAALVPSHSGAVIVTSHCLAWELTVRASHRDDCYRDRNRLQSFDLGPPV